MTNSTPTPPDSQKQNPRSQGQSDALVYRKTSDEVNFSAEAAELQRCADQKIALPTVKPVELIEYEASSNTLITRKIQGRELFHTLWNPTTTFGWLRGQRLPDLDTLSERISQAGQWLRRYHQSSRKSGSNPKADQALVESFNNKLNEVSATNLMPRRRVERLRHHCLGALTGEETPNEGFYCQIHGDFIIYNLMLDDDLNLHVLDFGDTRLGHSLEDVARFYSQLWAMAQTSRRRNKIFQPLADQFLKASGYSPAVKQTRRWRSLMAYNFVIHLNGQHAMRDLLSWNSRRELDQITRAGLKWIESTWP